VFIQIGWSILAFRFFAYRVGDAMLNHISGAMIAGGIFLIGAVATIDPDNVRAMNPIAPTMKADVVAPLPSFTDDTGMRMRAIYRKPEQQHRIIAVPDQPVGNVTPLTVISPYLTPVALRMAMRAGWAFPEDDDEN
jgi:hypothetical protein